MSIQTELTRIINAKAAIKTAIEGKGVTVPDGTLLDGMAALIDGIEAGGGSSWTDSYSVFATGTFTPTENTTEFSIDTGIPFDSAGGTDYRRQILIGYCEPSTGYSGQAGLLVFLWRAIGAEFDGATVVFGAIGFPNGLNTAKFIKGSNLPFPNERETIWNISGLSTSTNFRINRIYRWMLLGALK